MKLIKILFFCFILVFLLSGNAFATDWNVDYTYSPKNSRIPISQCYTVDKVITSFDAPNGILKAPSEIKVDKEDNLFIVDTENNRIVKLDSNGSFLKEFTRADKINFNKPKGIFIADNGELYIADTENKRVVHLSADGSFIESFIEPASNLFNKSFSFKPTKVAVDNRGYLNILNGTDYLLALPDAERAVYSKPRYLEGHIVLSDSDIEQMQESFRNSNIIIIYIIIFAQLFKQVLHTS